jgi:hypothetical protein
MLAEIPIFFNASNRIGQSVPNHSLLNPPQLTTHDHWYITSETDAWPLNYLWSMVTGCTYLWRGLLSGLDVEIQKDINNIVSWCKPLDYLSPSLASWRCRALWSYSGEFSLILLWMTFLWASLHKVIEL